ncbi:hypothetical protein [Paractinoplanes globisporus]|uniref:Antitoxin n=1 Tax=Paractinoplanes globisporus TaxID=113565 RepID=A0ABW6WVF4_9ACTN|nr:hypothetical protein [Actinoplanes globisporus]
MMRLFRDETRTHRAALIAARRRLREVSDRDGHVSDDFCDANAAVIEAEKPLRWWQRLDIDIDLYTATSGED